MELKDVFVAGGVACAHIVDDAYDTIPTWKLGEDEIQNFIETASDEDLKQTSAYFGCSSSEEEISKSLGNSGEFGKFYNSGIELTPAARECIFGDFEKFRDSKRDLIAPLITLLKAENINALPFGADYAINGAPAPQLLFVDLKLQETTERFDHKEAVSIVQKQQAAYPGIKPFVFLMSSLEVDLPQMREPFLRETKLFQSEFEAIGKSSFADAEDIKFLLAAFTRAMPQTKKLRESVALLNGSFNEAFEKVTEQLRNLDFADYFAVYHNTTSIEQTTLGVYIVELLLEFISHEIEGTDAVWKLHDGLQSLQLQNLPRARFGITLPAAKLYSAGLLHSPKRLIAEEKINRGPRDGYFYLGDIFWEAEELNHNLPSKAYVVITPACDTVRPDSMVESIMLCEGKVGEFVSGAIPNIRDALPVVLVKHPISGQDATITWDKSSLKLWDTKKRETFKSDKCTLVRIGRLRPTYALQLQHAVTSNLSRIGTQRPPSILSPRYIRCYVSVGNGRWRMIYKSLGDDAGATAEMVKDDDTFITYVLSDHAIYRIIRKLKAWMTENPAAESAAALSKIDGDEIVSALQSFIQKVPKQNNGKLDETAYPLSDIKDIGQLVAYIPSRSVTSPFIDIKNASKTKKDRPTRFLIVFGDKPDAEEPPDVVHLEDARPAKPA